MLSCSEDSPLVPLVLLLCASTKESTARNPELPLRSPVVGDPPLVRADNSSATAKG